MAISLRGMLSIFESFDDYNIILALGTRSAFFSMKAAELKCQNLIILVRKHVKWNILRHFAKRSAQYSVCKDQK